MIGLFFPRSRSHLTIKQAIFRKVLAHYLMSCWKTASFLYWPNVIEFDDLRHFTQNLLFCKSIFLFGWRKCRTDKFFFLLSSVHCANRVKYCNRIALYATFLNCNISKNDDHSIFQKLWCVFNLQDRNDLILKLMPFQSLQIQVPFSSNLPYKIELPKLNFETWNESFFTLFVDTL